MAKAGQAMCILRNIMEKDLTEEMSNYHIRRSYLRTMKQFMADMDLSIQPKTNQEIDEYLVYEKQLSFHLQGLLSHSKVTLK